MNKSLIALIVAIFSLFFFINAEDVPKCYCEVPEEERTACPAGASITRENCLRNHCCYSNSTQTIPGSPNCFERKASCGNDRCRVSFRQRRACGGWLMGKSNCERLNCCYDYRAFPYCYQSNDNAETTTQLPRVIPASSTPVAVVEPAINIDAEGPNTTFFNPDTATLTKFECNVAGSKTSCGRRFETRDTCLSRSCCWDSSNSPPRCYRPSETIVVAPRDDIQNVVTVFEEYMNIPSEFNGQFADGEDLPDKNSVVIECVNTEVAGVSNDLCPANNRLHCLVSSCCWNGTNCLRSVPISSSNTQEVAIPNVMKTNISLKSDNQQVVFVSVNIHEPVNNKQLTCESTNMDMACGYPGINRDQCVNIGCCWNSQNEIPNMNNFNCFLPNLVDVVPVEPVYEIPENSQNFWSPWGPWSACYVTEPCSDKAERVRWRECVNNEYYAGDENAPLGCTLQSEESDKITCTKPTECIDTYWSLWGPWSNCSPRGMQFRQRECVKDYLLGNENSLCEAADTALFNLVSETESQRC